MTELVKWTPKVRIWFWDIGKTENYVITDASNRDSIEAELNAGRIVNVEGVSISKSRFIKAEDLKHLKNSVQQFILLQTPHIREVLKLREAEKMALINKGFQTVEEIIYYLEKKGYKDDVRR